MKKWEHKFGMYTSLDTDGYEMHDDGKFWPKFVHRLPGNLVAVHFMGVVPNDALAEFWKAYEPYIDRQEEFMKIMNELAVKEEEKKRSDEKGRYIG